MFTVQLNTLTAAQYLSLCTSVGWSPPSQAQAEIALKHSCLTVGVWEGGRPVAMGRIVGDHAICFLVKDVVVSPEYQGRGAGRLVMETIVAYVQSDVPDGCNVSLELFASEGKEPFYEPFGFQKRPGPGKGHGMIAMVKGKKPAGMEALRAE